MLTVCDRAQFSTRVLLRKCGDPENYTAQVEAFDPDCNLAILRVDNPAFWTGTEILPLGTVPFSLENIVVASFPVRQENLLMNKGTVSGVSFARSPNTGISLLRITTEIQESNPGGEVSR